MRDHDHDIDVEKYLDMCTTPLPEHWFGDDEDDDWNEPIESTTRSGKVQFQTRRKAWPRRWELHPPK